MVDYCSTKSLVMDLIEIILQVKHFVMGMCKRFLDENPDGGVIYFESETITKQMVIDRGI